MPNVNNNLPDHIAFIMDGNGRWSNKRNLTIEKGHKKGLETAENISEICDKLGIKYITLYAFSTENWKRSEDEIAGLFKLIEYFFKNKIKKIIKRKSRINIIGDISKFPANTKKYIKKAVSDTKTFKNKVINIALNYGSRAEIIRATKLIINDINKNKILLKNVNESNFNNYLYTKNIPDPDLLIRTAGEYRISNFLLYQIAYSELYITKTLWPDFNKDDIQKALNSYKKRNRKFGGRKWLKGFYLR